MMQQLCLHICLKLSNAIFTVGGGKHFGTPYLTGSTQALHKQIPSNHIPVKLSTEINFLIRLLKKKKKN